MVNARLCETARPPLFFASPRHIDFLDCDTQTSKCFECEREGLRLLKFEPQISLRAIRMSENELVQKSYKKAFCRKYLCLYTAPQGTTDKFFDFVGFIMSYRGLCVAS